MSDLISRQAAIDALWKALYEYEDKTEKQFQESEDLDVGDWIEHRIFVQNMNDIDRQTILNLPSAQPEQRWIPCSERLPEERDWYLGIFKEPDTGWINPIPFICDYLLGTKTKATTKEGWILKGHTDREEYIDYYFNLECVAWMPLPEPYKYVISDCLNKIVNLPSAQPQLEECPIYGGMCGYPSNLCYECPRHEGAKERPQWWTEGLQPFAQPERTCVNCGRTINNGGWYADGRTRCPIEEHYALPKDGYCHLWEKRNVIDDDYPERRTDGRD